jgi:hypothetical protein
VPDIDGINTPSGSPTQTVVSLADPAFCTNSSCTTSSCTSGTCYVTLILGVGGGSLSGIEGGSAGCSGGSFAMLGFGPVGSCIPWNNGYTVVDLTQFSTFSTSEDLQIVMRNTMPNSTFTSVGQSVPFHTTEYTGGTAGLMGPYAPVVTYPLISSLSGTAPTPTLETTATLPSTPPVLTTVAVPTLSLGGNTVQWPTFWPGSSVSSQNLVCPSSLYSPNQPSTPTINFAASLVSTEELSTCITGTLGTCNAINGLSTQTDAFTTATAPPMPVTIVGTGFGYLPEVLPYVTQTSSYIEVGDDGHSPSGTAWDTNASASCQMYIANWTDTSISLVLNAPINAFNLYLGSLVPLSPLSDFSPLTLFPDSGNNTQNCPTANGDVLKFTVKNPQWTGSGGSTSLCVLIGTTGIENCSNY